MANHKHTGDERYSIEYPDGKISKVRTDCLKEEFDTYLLICPDLPVGGMTLDKIEAFFTKVNSDPLRNHDYRLATPKEWEYAARAGTNTPYNSSSMTIDVERFNIGYFAKRKNKGMGSQPLGQQPRSRWKFG